MPEKNEIPEGWSSAHLSEFIIHALGGEWGQSPSEIIPDDMITVKVIRGTEFRNWNKQKGSTAVERMIKKSSLEKRELKISDIVVEISGGGPEQPVGRTILIDKSVLENSNIPLICANFCRQIRLNPELNSKYINLNLQYQYQKGIFDKFQSQTTNIRNLQFKDFIAGVRVPLPPLPEQQRIVSAIEAIFSRLDAAEARLERVPEKMKHFRQSVLAAACDGRLTEDWRESYEPKNNSGSFHSKDREIKSPLELFEIPDIWQWKRIEDIIKDVQYGTSVKAYPDLETEIPVIRMGNIQDGEIELSDLKYIPKNTDGISPFFVKKGDVLFNRTNSPELVGKSACFDLELKALFASYLIRVNPNPEYMVSKYLCWWINSPWGREWAKTVRTDGVSQSNINSKKLKAMPIPLPPLPEQHEIVRRVDALFALADKIEERYAVAKERTEKLRQSVLAQAFSGRLVETEAEIAGTGGTEL